MRPQLFTAVLTPSHAMGGAHQLSFWRFRVAFDSMLALLVVLAATPVKAAEDPKMLGWTSDGAFFVWTEVKSTMGADFEYGREGPDGKWTPVPLAQVMKMSDEERVDLATQGEGETALDQTVIAVVHTVATGEQQRFPLSSKRLRPEGKAQPVDPKAFDAWKKAHRLVPLSGLRGPQNATAGEVEVDWPKEQATEGDEVTVHYYVQREGERLEVHTQDQGGAYGMFRPSYVTTWWWDPTGRRAALVILREAAKTMRGIVPAEAELVFAPVPPRAEVLAPARLEADVARVSALIEGAGVPVSATGVATKDREATVVYASPKFMAAAKRVAAALGATVEKLTWKANGELVIALGAPR